MRSGGAHAPAEASARMVCSSGERLLWFVISESAKRYLAAILDPFERFVVGWSVSAVKRLLHNALHNHGLFCQFVEIINNY
jgi:transposase InsO family protein